MPEAKTLAWRAIEGIKKRMGGTLVVDCSGKRKKMRAGKLLALSMVLAEKLRELPEERIGIVLPPGIGGFVANLAVALANKSSVNLNFTAATGVVRKAMEMAGVKTVLTASQVVEKFREFPWPVDTRELQKIFSEKGTRRRVLYRLAQAHLYSAARLARKWKVDKYSPKEATLLFSSGSTGIPKGVPLTHGNIGANVDQIETVKLLPTGTRILGCIPIFHSFGMTVTMWYPLCHVLRVITYPSPIDTTALGKIIKKERPSVLVGTPSFFRLYMKQIPARNLRSVTSVVAGAEKTPKGLQEK
jgi:acyl-[acyl-carrier-protein]-phospholipid O-acyltransferase/long-chain-fatty-acid--[acyl-carrier-protein] ligase